MKNYKECTQAEFDNAMAKKNEDVSTLTNQELYILKTKMKADMDALFSADTLYARDLYYRTKKSFEKYDEELRARMMGEKPSI